MLSQSCDTINRFRKKTTFKDKLGRILWNPDYNDYTDMEVHAELWSQSFTSLNADLCQDILHLAGALMEHFLEGSAPLRLW